LVTTKLEASDDMPESSSRGLPIHGIFAEVARRNPLSPALVFGSERLTYSELNDSADHLAGILRREGLVRGDRVAVFADRSLETIVAFLGILKAGGAYVPIDTAYPGPRVALLLQECSPFAVLTTRALATHELAGALAPSGLRVMITGDLLAARDAPQPHHDYAGPEETGPEDLAYILFTSGTTGSPKGVAVPHRAIARLVFDQEYARFGADRRFLQLASLSFDAATFEIWGPLLHGGTCVLYPGGSLPDPAELMNCIRDGEVTTAWLTSTLFNTIVTVKPEALSGLEELLIGGETLSVPHVRKALALLPGVQIINGYGPTENTTFTCCHRLPRELAADLVSIPIGKPIAGTQVYIVSDQLQPMAAGEVGEILCGGAGLATGYWNQEALTREKFITPAFATPGSTVLYRTGDYGRFLPGGVVEFSGRRDDQVKIRGFRIELGEINAVLLRHPAIRDAVVVADKQQERTVGLVAYVVSDAPSLTAAAVQEFLGRHLGSYMIPSEILFLPELPLTVNGKLDRARLPAPGRDRPAVALLAPGTETQKKLHAIWAGILRTEAIGIDMNFFDIGGTSLLSIELISEINKAVATTPRPLSVVHVYQYPTIRDFAEFLAGPGTPAPQAGLSAEDRAARQRLARQRNRRG
jgi:amino acid adenylation domain-containing protein